MSDKKLVPPRQVRNRSNCHWVTRLDGDNRCSPYREIWEWQPSAQNWVRPGFAGTGTGQDLVGYAYIAICPQPMNHVETKELQDILKKLKEKFQTGNADNTSLSKEDFDVINRSIHESMVWEKQFQ